MARLTPAQTVLTFNQTATENGNFYPCCVYSNDTFMQKFEESLIVAKSVIELGTAQAELIENILTGVSNYKVWKSGKTEELTTEITEHFGLLPNQASTLSLPFQPFNNIVTDILFYTYDEIQGIVEALQLATDILTEQSDERIEIVKSISDSFNEFFKAWNDHKERTGSLFADEKMMKVCQ